MATDFGTGRSYYTIVVNGYFTYTRFVHPQNASVEDLESAISRCKELVMGTDECSLERKWLGKLIVRSNQ